MTFTYTNRKGRTYHLHLRETRKGKSRYVFAREPGDGAIEEIPDGYEVRESVNGVVSLGKVRPRKIAEDEAQAVHSAMADLGLDDYRVEVKDDAVVVFEPDRSRAELEGIIRLLGPFGSNPRAMDVLTRDTRYSPVLRFVLIDDQARDFSVERMTYRGEGGWSCPWTRARSPTSPRGSCPTWARTASTSFSDPSSSGLRIQIGRCAQEGVGEISCRAKCADFRENDAAVLV